MTTEDLLNRVESMNRRVTHEWDVFMKANGTHWDGMSDEAKQKACELAEVIADRWVKLTNE